MSHSININSAASKEDIYNTLLPQVEALVSSDEPVTTALANVAAALSQAFEKISWAGFYLFRDGILWLGPFIGKTACTAIKPGSGVCGTAFAKGETIIVPDVDKFPGHIACDSGSRSEIVVPLKGNNQIIGVLDLDSYEYSTFDATDKKYLEDFCRILKNKLDLDNYIIT